MQSACIAMGSNIEPRREHLDAAVAALRTRLGPGGGVARVSQWHQTEAVVLPGDSPGSPYLNGACEVLTSLSPRALLDVCLEIERDRGRDRDREGRWGARTLDLDILLYGDAIIREPGLEIPHPRMLERGFALVPLVEIAGERMVPGTGKSVLEHLRALG
ncbi:MAG: 2-amino-4-hydroxy-6-hydroxymethyldihydropteridine diphosphokinase [Planctomycetes bacterium]|nr:2-amino-4-hydroxy-6-hydroxymethyldihydropteridine diphosphokinase [Planctomycetota bacterium]